MPGGPEDVRPLYLANQNVSVELVVVLFALQHWLKLETTGK